MQLTARELSEARNIARKVSHRSHTDIAEILNQQMRLKRDKRLDWRDIPQLFATEAPR